MQNDDWFRSKRPCLGMGAAAWSPHMGHRQAKAVNHIDTDLNWRISIASVPLRPGSLEIMPASGSWNLSLELSAKQGMDIDTNS
jgi:hypothetical protein